MNNIHYKQTIMGNITTCMRSSSIGKEYAHMDTMDFHVRETPLQKCHQPSVSSEQLQLPLPANKNTTSMKQTDKDASEQIFILCEKGTLQTIEFLIDNYPQALQHINDRYSCHVKGIIMQITPLQLAAACGHDDVLQYLLSLPTIEPNISDPMYLMTALHLAVFYQRMAAIEVLSKDLRIDLSERNVDGKTAIHLAIEKGSIAAVECILRIRPMLDFKVKDFDGNTVLHTAALFPSERIFQLLIQYIENQKRICASHSTEELYPSPYSVKKWKYLYEVTNFQGETALQVLKRNIAVLEAKRAAWYENHEQKEREKEKESTGAITDDHTTNITNNPNEHDLRMSSPIASIRHSFDQKLLILKACVQLLLDCSHVEAETLSSLGNHSPGEEDGGGGSNMQKTTRMPSASSCSGSGSGSGSNSEKTCSSGEDYAYWSPAKMKSTAVIDGSLHD